MFEEIPSKRNKRKLVFGVGVNDSDYKVIIEKTAKKLDALTTQNGWG